MIPHDAIIIILISTFTALLGEGNFNFFTLKLLFFSGFLGLTWLLVYRTDKYKKLKNEVEKRCKKCKKRFFKIRNYFNSFLKWKKRRKR